MKTILMGIYRDILTNGGIKKGFFAIALYVLSFQFGRLLHFTLHA